MREDVVAQKLLFDDGVLLPHRPNLHIHRNHRRFGPQHSHNSGMAILLQRPDNLRRVTHLIRLKLARQHHQDFALAHRHIHRTHIEERVSESQNAMAVIVSHRTQPRHTHIAIH